MHNTHRSNWKVEDPAGRKQGGPPLKSGLFWKKKQRQKKKTQLDELNKHVTNKL